MNVLSELRSRFAAALASIDPSATEYASLVLPSQDARFGDYQANCAMPVGKRLGRNPRQVAESLVAALDVADLCEPATIAGPGFINLRLQDTWLADRLQEMLRDTERLGIVPTSQPRTLVLDYSSPNIAKPMHVGHIRSTVIGDALARVLRHLGHRVITDNHVGDWGTQFGMIIYGFKHFGDEDALAEDTVRELGRLYQRVNRLIGYHAARQQQIPDLEAELLRQVQRVEELHDTTVTEDPREAKQAQKRLRQAEAQLADLRRSLDTLRQQAAAVEEDPTLAQAAIEHPEIGTAVLAETAALHAGDPTNRALWERFLPACLRELDRTYQRLHVTFDHTLGESFYHDRLAGVVRQLTAQGLVQESDGAQCIFLEGFTAPFIVQKQDGAFLYATTDLATMDYRRQEWAPDAILYVVDHRQSLHFEQLFATARAAGGTDLELTHVSFGTVLGEDGKPYKTRSGVAVGLSGLLDEAVQRAHRIVCENDAARPAPLLTTEQRLHVAERIGIGAIKYADLAHNRTSDYVFSYDKMLAMQGNTATYMQYSYARVRSIFSKGDVQLETLRQADRPPQLGAPTERALALGLLRFSEALERVAADYRPNHLTAYLFELASAYSSFFENCPVLQAEDGAIRRSRLQLCDLTARTIATGLQLLGIETVERM